MNATTGASTLQVNALEGPITQVAGTGRAYHQRAHDVDRFHWPNAYVITTSGLEHRPAHSRGSNRSAGAKPARRRELGELPMPLVASNGLLSIFGQNLGASEVAATMPLPSSALEAHASRSTTSPCRCL